VVKKIHVDAYNLVHAVPSLRRISEERDHHAACRALIDLFVRWLALLPSPPPVVLVFDGARPRGLSSAPPIEGLETRFAGEADDDIKELLERGGSHLLVSKDGDLVAFAEARGHEARDPAEFFESLVDDLRHWAEEVERSRPRGREEVEYWLARFGEASPAPPAAPCRDPGLSPEEVRNWLAYFGLEGGPA
jgi:hypothetical protein